jgi:creatinine amidohydrolase/Fe(II)-dependent formamide hydrolase-like protein
VGRAFLLVVLAVVSLSSAALAAPPSVQLEELTWTEVKAALQSGTTTIIIPAGGTEQSGPHMALGKHNLRARVLAGRIAATLGDTLVAPVLAYVPEGAISPPVGHMRFPGTISIPDATFKSTVEAAARSFRQAGFTHIVLLGDHGGYQKDLQRVVAHLNKRWAGSATRAFAPPEYYAASSSGYDKILRRQGFRDDEIGTHAGLADTSLQLAVAPQMVRVDRLHGAGKPDAADGVYGGDPRRATAALGQLGVDLIVRQTIQAIRKDTREH